MKKAIFFVSTNTIWGGSEILWSEAASLMLDHGCDVVFGVKYNKPVIETLTSKGARYVNLLEAPVMLTYWERILRKLKINKPQQEVFSKTLSEENPQLVVISQGNNIDGRYYMQVCRNLSIPYVTITQLVAEFLLSYVDDSTIRGLSLSYKNSRMNYFVSQANIELHNNMIGEDYANSKVAHNPFTVPVNSYSDYPVARDGIYHIALVGRLETYHKGHDLLLKVISQEKWKNRLVVFHFYGEGPHKIIIERLIKKYGIQNVIFEGQVSDVADIWSKNHIMVLPSRMEGQSLALIEAMWCYRGAVVTDVGGASELIKEGVSGYIADFATHLHLDNALEKAWLDRDRWEEVGKNAGASIREMYSTLPIVSFVNEINQIISEQAAI